MNPASGAATGGDDMALFGSSLPQARQFAELLAGSAVERGLIGPREAPRIWERHVLNCAMLAPLLPRSARVADVGSGAGLPGIVLAITRPDARITLIEPLLRRVTWLRWAIDELRLANVEIKRSRAEDLRPELGSFDVVTARAVAPMARLAQWCLPLLRSGGVLLAMKGESIPAELAEAEGLLRECGAVTWRILELRDGIAGSSTRVVEVVNGDTRIHRSTAGSDTSRRL